MSEDQHADVSTPESGLRPKVHTLDKDTHEGLPVWIRCPKSGPEHYTGVTRSKLYEWAAKGYIRSVSIREPGKLTGSRRFHLPSILEFIAKCEARGGKML